MEKDILCASFPFWGKKMYMCPHCHEVMGWGKPSANIKYCSYCGGKFSGKIKEKENTKQDVEFMTKEPQTFNQRSLEEEQRYREEHKQEIEEKEKRFLRLFGE